MVRVPVESDNIGGLEAIEDHLLYVERGGFYYGRESDVKPSIMIFSIKDREESVLAADAGGYAVSQDGKKLLVRSGPAFKLLRRQAETGRREDRVDGRASWSTASPPRSGRRSSTRCGGGSATSSTRRTCTGTTGRRSATSIERSSRTSATGPI